MSDFWVFGYGSLMWRPGFEYTERKRAKIYGLHRRFCVHSWEHRGTQSDPGLVLGLDTGGSCIGLAMKVAGNKREEVINYLRKRELITKVYVECWRDVELETGERVSALVYRADRKHIQYAKGLSLDEQVKIIRHAKGAYGPNIEYACGTVEAMLTEGIRDKQLEYIYHKLA